MALDCCLHVNESVSAIGGEALERLVNPAPCRLSPDHPYVPPAPDAVLTQLIYQPERTNPCWPARAICWPGVRGWKPLLNESNHGIQSTRSRFVVTKSAVCSCPTPWYVSTVSTANTRSATTSCNPPNTVSWSPGQEIANLIEDGGFIKRGEKVKPVCQLRGSAVDWLMGEGKRGIYIQRYKGWAR